MCPLLSPEECTPLLPLSLCWKDCEEKGTEIGWMPMPTQSILSALDLASRGSAWLHRAKTEAADRLCYWLRRWRNHLWALETDLPVFSRSAQGCVCPWQDHWGGMGQEPSSLECARLRAAQILDTWVRFGLQDNQDWAGWEMCFLPPVPVLPLLSTSLLPPRGSSLEIGKGLCVITWV